MSYLDAIEDEEERRAALAEEESPCFDDDEPVAERHDHEILMSGESHDPVGLICSCGKRYRVVPE